MSTPTKKQRVELLLNEVADAVETLLLEADPVLSSGYHLQKTNKILHYDIGCDLLEVHIISGSGVSLWKKPGESIMIDSNRLLRLANDAWDRYHLQLLEGYLTSIKKASKQ